MPNDDPRLAYRVLRETQPHLFTGKADEISIITDEEEIDAAERELSHKLRARDLPVSWAKIGQIYSDQYLVILRDAVRFPDGRLGTYIRCFGDPEEPTGAAVLASIESRLVLVRTFRHATRRRHIEVPRGVREHGESSLACAQRELEEETGLRSDDLCSLGLMYTDTALIASPVELFHGECMGEPVAQAAEGIIEVLLVPYKQIWNLVAEGEIADSFSLSALAARRLADYRSADPREEESDRYPLFPAPKHNQDSRCLLDTEAREALVLIQDLSWEPTRFARMADLGHLGL